MKDKENSLLLSDNAKLKQMVYELAHQSYCYCITNDTEECTRYPGANVIDLPCYSDYKIGIQCWTEWASIIAERNINSESPENGK